MWLALAALSSGKHKHDCAQRALALLQSGGDDVSRARTLLQLAFSLYQMGRLEEALEVGESALATWRAFGSNRGVTNCLNLLACVQVSRGNRVAARDLYGQALAACKSLRNEAGASLVLGNLAELEFGDGHVEQALLLAREAQELYPGGKSSSSRGPQQNIAAYRIALGDIDGAREATREALRWARQAQHAMITVIALQQVALLLALHAEVQDAARLIGYVNVQFKELGYEREPNEKWVNERLMAVLHEHLTDPEIEKLAAEGAAWSEDRAAEEALKV
jgi:tetratricopeptide (TPR) repeat protein